MPKKTNLVVGPSVFLGATGTPNTLHRASARYDPAREVHEVAELDGESAYLENPLTHYNYDSVAEFVARQFFA